MGKNVNEGEDYASILADHLQPVVQTVFPHKRQVFQDDNAPILTQGIARD